MDKYNLPCENCGTEHHPMMGCPEKALTAVSKPEAGSEEDSRAAPGYANPAVAAARTKFQAAADQLKRGEWSSFNSGTWQLINDGLILLDSHTSCTMEEKR